MHTIINTNKYLIDHDRGKWLVVYYIILIIQNVYIFLCIN